MSLRTSRRRRTEAVAAVIDDERKDKEEEEEEEEEEKMMAEVRGRNPTSARRPGEDYASLVSVTTTKSPEWKCATVTSGPLGVALDPRIIAGEGATITRIMSTSALFGEVDEGDRIVRANGEFVKTVDDVRLGSTGGAKYRTLEIRRVGHDEGRRGGEEEEPPRRANDEATTERGRKGRKCTTGKKERRRRTHGRRTGRWKGEGCNNSGKAGAIEVQWHFSSSRR